MISRLQIIRAARELVGTPYRRQGRVKGVGVDCVGVVLLVCEQLQIQDVDGTPLLGSDYRAYPEFPEDGFVHRELQRRAIEKPRTELRPGDFVSLRHERRVLANHCGIISDLGGGLGLIHCRTSRRSRRRNVSSSEHVVEHIFGGFWPRCLEGVFTFPGVSE